MQGQFFMGRVVRCSWLPSFCLVKHGVSAMFCAGPNSLFFLISRVGMAREEADHRYQLVLNDTSIWSMEANFHLPSTFSVLSPSPCDFC